MEVKARTLTRYPNIVSGSVKFAVVLNYPFRDRRSRDLKPCVRMRQFQECFIIFLCDERDLWVMRNRLVRLVNVLEVGECSK